MVNITGTNGRSILNGTAGADVITGLVGDDIIDGGAVCNPHPFYGLADNRVSISQIQTITTGSADFAIKLDGPLMLQVASLIYEP